jgi:DNA replicative helicase MCM subunit Mcm2 (Cdc46/Mcm family)
MFIAFATLFARLAVLVAFNPGFVRYMGQLHKYPSQV